MVPVVGDLAVDLVAEHVEVVLDGELPDLLQVTHREHAAGGILGGVDDDQPGTRRDLALQLLDVEAELVALAQGDWHRRPARQAYK